MSSISPLFSLTPPQPPLPPPTSHLDYDPAPSELQQSTQWNTAFAEPNDLNNTSPPASVWGSSSALDSEISAVKALHLQWDRQVDTDGPCAGDHWFNDDHPHLPLRAALRDPSALVMPHSAPVANMYGFTFSENVLPDLPFADYFHHTQSMGPFSRGDHFVHPNTYPSMPFHNPFPMSSNLAPTSINPLDIYKNPPPPSCRDTEFSAPPVRFMQVSRDVGSTENESIREFDEAPNKDIYGHSTKEPPVVGKQEVQPSITRRRGSRSTPSSKARIIIRRDSIQKKKIALENNAVENSPSTPCTTKVTIRTDRKKSLTAENTIPATPRCEEPVRNKRNQRRVANENDFGALPVLDARTKTMTFDTDTTDSENERHPPPAPPLYPFQLHPRISRAKPRTRYAPAKMMFLQGTDLESVKVPLKNPINSLCISPDPSESVAQGAPSSLPLTATVSNTANDNASSPSSEQQLSETVTKKIVEGQYLEVFRGDVIAMHGVDGREYYARVIRFLVGGDERKGSRKKVVKGESAGSTNDDDSAERNESAENADMNRERPISEIYMIVDWLAPKDNAVVLRMAGEVELRPRDFEFKSINFMTVESVQCTRRTIYNREASSPPSQILSEAIMEGQSLQNVLRCIDTDISKRRKRRIFGFSTTGQAKRRKSPTKLFPMVSQAPGRGPLGSMGGGILSGMFQWMKPYTPPLPHASPLPFGSAPPPFVPAQPQFAPTVSNFPSVPSNDGSISTQFGQPVMDIDGSPPSTLLSAVPTLPRNLSVEYPTLPLPPNPMPLSMALPALDSTPPWSGSCSSQSTFAVLDDPTVQSVGLSSSGSGSSMLPPRSLQPRQHHMPQPMQTPPYVPYQQNLSACSRNASQKINLQHIQPRLLLQPQTPQPQQQPQTQPQSQQPSSPVNSLTTSKLPTSPTSPTSKISSSIFLPLPIALCIPSSLQCTSNNILTLWGHVAASLPPSHHVQAFVSSFSRGLAAHVPVFTSFFGDMFRSWMEGLLKTNFAQLRRVVTSLAAEEAAKDLTSFVAVWKSFTSNGSGMPGNGATTDTDNSFTCRIGTEEIANGTVGGGGGGADAVEFDERALACLRDAAANYLTSSSVHTASLNASSEIPMISSSDADFILAKINLYLTSVIALATTRLAPAIQSTPIPFQLAGTGGESELRSNFQLHTTRLCLLVRPPLPPIPDAQRPAPPHLVLPLLPGGAIIDLVRGHADTEMLVGRILARLMVLFTEGICGDVIAGKGFGRYGNLVNLPSTSGKGQHPGEMSAEQQMRKVHNWFMEYCNQRMSGVA